MRATRIVHGSGATVPVSRASLISRTNVNAAREGRQRQLERIRSRKLIARYHQQGTFTARTSAAEPGKALVGMTVGLVCPARK